MKLLNITFILTLFVCSARAMNKQIIPAKHIEVPDLMPPAGKEIIEILNNPEKYEQPDHILVIGEPGSGKSTICRRLMQNINASGLSCNAYDLIKSYGLCTDQAAIQRSLAHYLILPAIKIAQEQHKSRAALVIVNFHALHRKQHMLSIRRILNALNPAHYANLQPPLLIINESLPLTASADSDPIEGPNVILVTPPSAPAPTNTATSSQREHSSSRCIIS